MLWLMFQGGPSVGRTWITVPSKGNVGSYERGQVLEAELFDPKHHAISFWPWALHQPLAFKGLRYSVIWFMAGLRLHETGHEFNSAKADAYLRLGLPAEGLAALALEKPPSLLAFPWAQRRRLRGKAPRGLYPLDSRFSSSELPSTAAPRRTCDTEGLPSWAHHVVADLQMLDFE